MPLVQSIFNKTMLDMGQEVSNNRMSSYPCIAGSMLTNNHSLLAHPLLTRRFVQHRCHQAVEDLH